VILHSEYLLTKIITLHAFYWVMVLMYEIWSYCTLLKYIYLPVICTKIHCVAIENMIPLTVFEYLYLSLTFVFLRFPKPEDVVLNYS